MNALVNRLINPHFFSVLATAWLLAHSSMQVVSAATTEVGPIKVEIFNHDNAFTLMVDGRDFVAKGAGVAGDDINALRNLSAAGGNAFRTWDTSVLDEQLQAAERYDLMVLVGLDLKKQLQGFDYTDPEAVHKQHDELMQVVRQYQNHPQILGWILGNEPNLMVGDSGEVVPVDPLVYEAIGALAKDIERTDSHRPKTVTFAFTATLEDDIRSALSAAPDLDFISLQAYGALPVIPQLVADMDLDMPFMITEYGPLGHWEMPSTKWGREIEEPSGLKAQGMERRMQGSVIDDPTGKLLGSFAFLWGHKQERTPTWYGLFLDSGEKTASVDELTRVWSGHYPPNRAPSAWSISLNDQVPGANVTVRAGDSLLALAKVTDPENDELIVSWKLMEEVKDRSHGGHFEQRPDELRLENITATVGNETAQLEFKAPDSIGEYRLYMVARDANGGAATANIPFLVVE